jgi:endonuclease/exonuclease/phosphatase family metal-dependent hydrolase
LRAVECRVVTEAGDASDHLPVVATFEMADPA